jgi:hypothetical protein
MVRVAVNVEQLLHEAPGGIGRYTAELLRLLPAQGVDVTPFTARHARDDVERALRAQGLDGVEVRHPSHSPSDISRLSAIARELDLVPSGGSDWHGAADGPRTIGMMQVPSEWLAEQESRLASLGRAPAT